MNIAIMGSGSGSTAEAFIEATIDGRIDASVAVVISDHPEAGLFDRVERLNKEHRLSIKTIAVNAALFPHEGPEPKPRGITDPESEELVRLMLEHDIGLVGLMGYMRVIRGTFLEQFGYDKDRHSSMYECRLLNTHPGPLPETADTFGVYTSQKVLDLGLAQSRHTLHCVSAGVDEGPIILQTPVPVLDGDSAEDLFARVQLIEKAVLPLAFENFLLARRKRT